MRAHRIALGAVCCVAALAACGSNTFRPRAGEHFSFTQTPNPGGSLSDLASQVTMDTLLRHRGARLVKAEPFPPCPGEAGLQTFKVLGPHGTSILRIAFTEWNGTQKIASYERPAKASDDPAAMEALRRSVCTG